VSRPPRVVAAVVTCNRVDLLREALEAIKSQTRRPDAVVVVDNASSDGTREMLADEFPEVVLVALPENQGGAGGYHEAIRAGCGAGAAWLWLLDDDSFPRPTALAELLAPLELLDGRAQPAILCSRVEWRDGEPHPMNRPTVRRRDPEQLVEAVRLGLLPLRCATFVSLLLSRDAVERVGLPFSHYFWQADDIEYTARALRDATGYFVPGSVVEHRTPSKHTSIGDRQRFYYHARNTLYMLRGDAWAGWEKPAIAWAFARSIVEYLGANRASPASLRTLASALGAGLARPARTPP
jgi:rhamnopyranosyl-N-acetylglucosaminyl-diphospho-decaprenol beta-1,3/1,4-galactofuranosyltransferase